MKTANFHSWTDFKEFGINYLTGESCAYGMRALCDVSNKGRETLCSFLGLPYDTAFAENWNSMVGDDPAIGSMLIPRGLFKELARYIAFNVLNFKYVVEMPNGYVHAYADGYFEDNGLTLAKARGILNGNWYTNHALSATGAVVGGRNVHAFSGRAT